MIKTININNKYLYLLLLVLLVRLPFFSEVLIDGDETTFLIIGKWFMEGNTPYERYTDFNILCLLYLWFFISSIKRISFYFQNVWSNNYFLNIDTCLQDILIIFKYKKFFFCCLSFYYFKFLFARNQSKYSNTTLSNVAIYLFYVFVVYKKKLFISSIPNCVSRIYQI